jgi:hypothetical protein
MDFTSGEAPAFCSDSQSHGPSSMTGQSQGYNTFILSSALRNFALRTALASVSLKEIPHRVNCATSHAVSARSTLVSSCSQGARLCLSL